MQTSFDSPKGGVRTYGSPEGKAVAIIALGHNVQSGSLFAEAPKGPFTPLADPDLPGILYYRYAISHVWKEPNRRVPY